MHFTTLSLLALVVAAVSEVSGAVVKDGSTCIVTRTQAAAATDRKSIGTVHPSRRDLDPAAEEAYMSNMPNYVGPEPGQPGALGHYPRPVPSRGGSRPPATPYRYYPKKPEQAQEMHGFVLEERDETTLLDRSDSSEDTVEATTVDDDTPQILSAFKQCRQDSTIIFQEGVYNIRQVMNTTDLSNVSIEIHGTFVWSADNIQYWLRSSYGVTYAGRSTAWLFGGRDVSMRGFGKALFNGNGQVWIDQNRNAGNQNGRPISLTVWRGTNIYIDGITWRMAQFWHTFVAHSQNVTMTNLDMNTTSNSQWKAVNTDGTDTWNSRDVVISNWTVSCGDDCISVKGNSTNIYVSNIVCHESGGMCIGSMGSNAGQPDFVDNVVFENVSLYHSSNAAWIKTYPGQGHVRNVTFRNIHFENVNQPIYVIPCIYSAQNCDGSHITISDIHWENITGTSRYNVAAGIHCSAAAPCTDLHFSDIDIKPMNGGTAKILCSNIKNQATSGLQCTGSCPASQPQQLTGNV